MAKKQPTTPTLALAILREITELTSALIEQGLVDRQNYAAVTEGPASAWKVAQTGASIHLALKNRPYDEVYRSLAETDTYNLVLLDQALMQFSYEGIGNTVLRHRLAYLPSPNLRPFQDDPDLYIAAKHFVEVVGHQVVPVPVRFDFDARDGVSVDVVHPVSHVTLGQYQHCRIPVTHPLSPREFSEFVLHHFYSTPATDRISLNAHMPKQIPTITDQERDHIHLSIGTM
ncbi:DUF2290 domain-containing protein [Mycobacteroides chelonae]|uniref:DUF2290 domain-containing protein n=1 Tax=Mycobacteroides chelonae TaxID=1774 RepID=UPI0013F4CF9E|nr:DUF2290 domain-containing protein [Mycobacteroides chelonae]